MLDNKLMAEAACLQEPDPDIFFSDEEYRYDPIKVRRAKFICMGCPIKQQCLQDAIENDYQGVFGGMTDAERTRHVKAIARTPKQLEILKATNDKRTVLAAQELIPILEKALMMYGNDMSPETREIVELRVANPTLTLSELVPLVSRPVNKDYIAGRIRRTKEAVERGYAPGTNKKGTKVPYNGNGK